MKWIRRLGWFLIGFVGLFGVLYLVGLFVPKTHTYTLEAQFDHPIDLVWQTITDLEATPSWRRGLDEIERLEDRDGKPLWRLDGDFGTVYYLVEAAEPMTHYVNRVVDGDDFGGTWTFTLRETPTGCALRITEDGEIYNPIFRTMIHYVYDYGTSVRNYLEDLDAALAQREANPPEP